MHLFVDKHGPLSAEAENDLQNQFETELGGQIPLLAPLFGIIVIVAAIWDYFIDPSNALQSLVVRIAGVAIGTSAYWRQPFQWTTKTRRAVIYFTHTYAVIIATFLLQEGFVYQQAGIIICVFPLCIMALRIRDVLLLSIPPFLLLMTLAALLMPFKSFASIVFVYLLAVGVTCMLMQANRISRKTAYLLEQQLTTIAHRDSLTGLYNRGYLTEVAEREFALARRHDRQLAIAMLDIDHFKSVNDTYGHDIGDEVIKALADTCMTTLRRIDHVGRIGGEEFVCIMPETSAVDALAAAERMRKQIGQLEVHTSRGNICFTVSIGVAVLSSHADWPALLKDADMALYQAKQTGRNKVVLAAEASQPEVLRASAVPAQG